MPPSPSKQFAPLATVKHRVQLGRALPFGVCHADGTLLLARGHVLSSAEQLAALLERGALVQIAELLDTKALAEHAPRAQLPALWSDATQRLAKALASGTSARFVEALDDAANPMSALVARDPDLAIFQVLRQDPDTAYGVQRSLQTAITSLLVARRLGWDEAEGTRAFKVALTMNVSMLELQGQLAMQMSAPTSAQREALRSHPMRSVQLLRTAGIVDALWLEAVLQHHESEDGSGYPSGRRDVHELASLVRRADVYTSKLASRCTRDALAADVAGRQMFMQDPGHPMTAALVKEFGIYPPGCHVRLASGEVGMVVARGPTITAPVVACLTDAKGRSLPAPQRVDTTERSRAVVAVVGEALVPKRPALDKLIAALA
jgi:HD-GYP domain-containing protein (c-di-GMP phosphodiesterase class II)